MSEREEDKGLQLVVKGPGASGFGTKIIDHIAMVMWSLQKPEEEGGWTQL